MTEDSSKRQRDRYIKERQSDNEIDGRRFEETKRLTSRRQQTADGRSVRRGKRKWGKR